jgi:4-aminobutyrate aminotransferase/(S)-3-amino-2-methylpropionate transaminase
MITLAKGIAGGLPLAAVTGRAEIMDAPHAGGLGGTYGGNPIATAAALGALKAYDEHDLLARARELGAIIQHELTALQERDARIGDIRGRGAMMAIELVDENGAPDAALTNRVAKHCHVNGVVVLTCGTDGNVIRLLPPLSISDDLLREGIGVIAEALAAN